MPAAAPIQPKASRQIFFQKNECRKGAAISPHPSSKLNDCRARSPDIFLLFLKGQNVLLGAAEGAGFVSLEEAQGGPLGPLQAPERRM